ncbi:hypothetical protein [Paraburkholderia sp. BL10I2N1]|uniref:hypothetical protein n=1 Tax=Paraburkholderia sp. BL10I2N1 TaxID=1938796 RepID=UPI00105FC853|nr:hypothetical protein [Paraburkholderia sp. BL10I2N1]TDN58938.1 hypothetical protein B0G77_8114 [Paraburkholderia sp. BL10I2N1]
MSAQQPRIDPLTETNGVIGSGLLLTLTLSNGVEPKARLGFLIVAMDNDRNQIFTIDQLQIDRPHRLPRRPTRNL